MDGPDNRSDDDGLPTSPTELLARLAALGIAENTFEHPPVFTVAEAKALRNAPLEAAGGGLEGAHIKNLFLRDKKKRMWLLTALEHRTIDLKALGGRIGARGLSFASPERLLTYLGVRPGAVTPLAVINDRKGAVQVLLDRALLEASLVNCHPLVNWMTTALTPAALLTFLEAEGHPPRLIDFEAAAGSSDLHSIERL